MVRSSPSGAGPGSRGCARSYSGRALRFDPDGVAFRLAGIEEKEWL